MGYSVYVQRFTAGEAATMPLVDVAVLLAPHGTLGSAGSYIEFTPSADDVCEVGLLSGSAAEGVAIVSFVRPASSATLREIVFALLGIPGVCFFEVDCTYVLARTDVTADLPDALLTQCESGRVTVIDSVDQITL